MKTNNKNDYCGISQVKDGSISSSSISHTPEFDLEFNSNDRLLKNFKELREQLKEATKVNQKLKGKLIEREN